MAGASRGCPDEGLDNFNYDYQKPINTMRCCTYKLNGERA